MSLTAEDAKQMTKDVINKIDISSFIATIDGFIFKEIARGSCDIYKYLFYLSTPDYNPDTIIYLIKNYYKNLGYLDISIEPGPGKYHYFSMRWRLP